MNLTASPPAAATAALPVTLGGTARVELKAIVHERSSKSLIVYFTDGRRNWTVQIGAAQVQTFARFQATVADQIGLWVEHESQYSRHARVRSEDWQTAVAAAFEVGAKR